MPINIGAKPVDINKRRVINGADADVMQLYPMRHTFAWDAYNTGNANHWLPTEIGMQKDIEQWRSQNVLTEDERKAFETVLGFFTTADSIAAAASGWPSDQRSIIAAERMVPNGFARSCPAMSGAEPWMGS